MSDRQDFEKYGVEQAITLATTPINEFIVLEGAELPRTIEFPIPAPMTGWECLK